MTFLKPDDSVPTYSTCFRWQRDWAKNHLRKGDLSFLLQDGLNKIIKEKDPAYFAKYNKNNTGQHASTLVKNNVKY